MSENGGLTPAEGDRLREEYERKERRQNTSHQNEVVLDPESANLLAQKVADEVQARGSDGNAFVTELASQLATRQEQERLKAEETAKQEHDQLVQEVIKEAGSSLTGLTDFLEAAIAQDQQQIREEAERNPPRTVEYPDPRRWTGFKPRKQ